MQNLLNDCIRFFGLTENPNEAGYILPSGKLLDFSGRHLKIGIPDERIRDNYRALIHSNFIGINKAGYKLTKDYPEIMISGISPVGEFMKATRCIRVNVDTHYNYISFIYKPTKEQLDTILRIFEENSLAIELHDSGCNTIADIEYTFLTKASLYNTINAWF